MNSQKPEFNSEQLERMWNHRQEQNSNFNNYVNFFLLAESIFLVVAAMLVSNPIIEKPFLILIIVIALVITLTWIYILGKQRFISMQLRERCKRYMPEYESTKKEREIKKDIFRFSNMRLLAYVIPSLVAMIWIIILVSIIWYH